MLCVPYVQLAHSHCHYCTSATDSIIKGFIPRQSGLPHGEGYLGDEDLVTEEAMYRIKLMQNWDKKSHIVHQHERTD